MNLEIILVQPQLPENIGMIARAMANFGFARLKLVKARAGWPNKLAWPASAGAEDILNNASHFNSLPDACKTAAVTYATTARKRHDQLRSLSLVAACDEMVKLQGLHQQPIPIAIIFGCEQSGLSNQQLSLAGNIVHIPTDPSFSSLNLAQAVLLFCYQLRASQLHASKNLRFDKNLGFDNGYNLSASDQQLNTQPHTHHQNLATQNLTPPNLATKNLATKNLATKNLATHGEKQRLLTLLLKQLEQSNYFRDPRLKRIQQRRITNFWHRNLIYQVELQACFGIIKALADKTGKAKAG